MSEIVQTISISADKGAAGSDVETVLIGEGGIGELNQILTVDITAADEITRGRYHHQMVARMQMSRFMKHSLVVNAIIDTDNTDEDGV